MQTKIGDAVIYCSDMYEAAVDADALCLVTEWKEFRIPSWNVLLKLMKQPVVLDGRNIYERNELKEKGFQYYCIG
jgi:UDPglucose 6-dehydrogenase